MNFIDKTYFFGDIYIDFGDDQTESTELLDSFENIETKLLREALGYDLYKQFINGLADVTPAAKWINLRDGSDFTVTDEQGRNVTVHWNGLINTEKESFLSYFIYYQYIKNQITQNTITGEVLSINENSNVFFNNYKLIKAYNNGIDLYGRDLDLITGKNAILRGTRFVNNAWNDIRKTYNKPIINYYEEILKGTLYNYIYFTNETTPNTYTNWNFMEKKYVNVFGI